MPVAYELLDKSPRLSIVPNNLPFPVVFQRLIIFLQGNDEHQRPDIKTRGASGRDREVHDSDWTVSQTQNIARMSVPVRQCDTVRVSPIDILDYARKTDDEFSLVEYRGAHVVALTQFLDTIADHFVPLCWNEPEAWTWGSLQCDCGPFGLYVYISFNLRMRPAKHR